MRKQAIRSTAWIVLSLVAIAGCGGTNLDTVEGKVTLDGKPLNGVHVSFFPEGAGVNDPTVFHSVTDAEGHFALRNPVTDQTGAAPGRYRVSLSTAVAGPNDTETTPLPPERIPTNSRETKFEVPDGGTAEADFELKSR